MLIISVENSKYMSYQSNKNVNMIDINTIILSLFEYLDWKEKEKNKNLLQFKAKQQKSFIQIYIWIKYVMIKINS